MADRSPTSDRALAERLVRVAGAIALELRGGAAEVKGYATDVVTEADRRAEAAMLELLRAERPGDGVLGEEGAAVGGDGGRRWLLDPVDGTLNYASGLPAWCAAVALLDPAGAAVAAVHDPVADETFTAARGAGAALNGAPLRVRRRRRGSERPSWPRSSTCAGATTSWRRAPSGSCARSARCGRSAAARSSSRGSPRDGCTAGSQADVEPWDWHPGALLVAESGGAARVSGRWHVAAAGPSLATSSRRSNLRGCYRVDPL